MNEAVAYLQSAPGTIQAERGQSPAGHDGWWVRTLGGWRFVSDLELDRQGLDVTHLAQAGRVG